MTDSNKPVFFAPSKTGTFSSKLDEPLSVTMESRDALETLIATIGKNKAEGFFDDGRTCFHMSVGIPHKGVFSACRAVASLTGVSKKGNRYTVTTRLLMVEGRDGVPYTRDGDGEEGRA